MFLTGQNIFNQTDAADRHFYFSLPQKCSVPTSLVKVIFSWSNLGTIERVSGDGDQTILKVFGFKSEQEGGGSITVLDDIADAAFSWDGLFLVHKDGRCSASKIGEDVAGVTCETEIFTNVFAGDNHIIGLKEDGTVYSLDNELVPRLLPVRIPVKAVACGKEHTLLLTRNGNIYSFGIGSRAQLGHGDLDVEPTKKPRLVESLEGLIVNQISAGGWHSAAVSDEGDLYIWGWNECGQLGFPRKRMDQESLPGVDTITFLPSPTFLGIGEQEVKKVECGSRHTAVLTENNDVYTWGWNAYGQLGHGDTLSRDCPTQVHYFKDGGLPVVDIFCGGWNTLFLTTQSGEVT